MKDFEKYHSNLISTDLPQNSNLISKDFNDFSQLIEKLSDDLPIEQVEYIEKTIKQLLYKIMKYEVDGRTARFLAKTQQKLGLLLKYKSYSIKCSSILGYSIFFQNQGKGFSFQRHLSHKIEVFHILKVKKGGFVFLCNFEDWKKFYRENKFNDWLEGNGDPDYEQFCFYPKPGDVFLVNQLGLVHSVIGCELEEFANDSTDMVERLHDQNKGETIPKKFDRKFAFSKINQVKLPSKNRLVTLNSKGSFIDEIHPEKIKGGYKTSYAHMSFIANKYFINPQEETNFFYDQTNTTSIFIAEGKGKILIADHKELKGNTIPSLDIQSGDLIMIPSSIFWKVLNEEQSLLKLSEHKIPLNVAFHEIAN